MSTGSVMPLRETEPFSAMLAQDGLAEYEPPGKTPLKHPAMAAAAY